MPYITKYKLKHTLFKIHGKILSDPIQQILRDKLFFLSRQNREYVAILLLFLKDPEHFIKSHYIEWKDTLTYIVEKNPAFHSSLNCDRLSSDFENIFIPNKIKAIGRIPDLRAFAEKHRNLFSQDRGEFIRRCIEYFRDSVLLTPGDFIPIDRPNSGVSVYRDASINEILEAIRGLFQIAKDFVDVEENMIVVRNLGDKLYLRDKEEIPRPLGLLQKTVKEALNKLYEINRDFVEAATEYFTALLNPQKEFDATILSILNFKACGSCYHGVDINKLFDEAFRKDYLNKSLMPVTNSDSILKEMLEF